MELLFRIRYEHFAALRCFRKLCLDLNTTKNQDQGAANRSELMHSDGRFSEFCLGVRVRRSELYYFLVAIRDEWAIPSFSDIKHHKLLQVKNLSTASMYSHNDCWKWNGSFIQTIASQSILRTCLTIQQTLPLSIIVLECIKIIWSLWVAPKMRLMNSLNWIAHMPTIFNESYLRMNWKTKNWAGTSLKHYSE